MLLERVTMCSLAEGRNFELSLGKDAGDKTLVFVKLTDAALKSIEECIMPNKGIAVLNPVVQFHSTSGVLKLPHKEKLCKSYGFTLSYVEGDGSQGSFECLHHQEMESLESLGAMLLKIQINAKDDTYEKTRVKMAAAEEENKKFGTKEIDPSAPYVGKKVKVKRPVVSMLPKLCSPLYKSDKVSYKTTSDYSSMSKENRSYPSEDMSNDEIFGDQVSREDNVNKILNCKKDEHMKKDYSLGTHSDDVSEKRGIIDTDCNPCEPNLKKLKSTEKLFKSLDILNFDNQLMSKNCNYKATTGQQCLTEDSLCDDLDMETSSVRVLENERDLLLDSYDENVSLHDRFKCDVNNLCGNEDIDPCFVSFKNLGEYEAYDSFKKRDMQNIDTTTFKRQGNDCRRSKNDDPSNLLSESMLCGNSPSLSSSSIDSPDSEKELEVHGSFLYPLDYSRSYVKITSQHQRDCYKSDFDADYEQYKILHCLVKQAVVKFTTFENELKRYKPGTEEYMKIKEQIYQEYFLNANDQSYQNAYNRLHYLHGKLSHIKKLVLAYDQALSVEL